MDLSSLLLIVSIVIIFVIIASMRKGTSAVSTKPTKIKSFTVPESLKNTKKIILKFATESKFDIDDIDGEPNRIILSDKPTATTWGFFYPIYISNEDDRTIVEVGIKSRLAQGGPLVNRAHEYIFNQIKATFLINAN